MGKKSFDFQTEDRKINNPEQKKLRAFWSTSELYRLDGRRWSAKLVPNCVNRSVSGGQRNGTPWPLISVFWTGAAIFIQVNPLLPHEAEGTPLHTH
jgi:hypothetical protein